MLVGLPAVASRGYPFIAVLSLLTTVTSLAEGTTGLCARGSRRSGRGALEGWPAAASTGLVARGGTWDPPVPRN